MKEIKDSCFNEFDPNALSVSDALQAVLKSVKSQKKFEYVKLKNSLNRILSRNIKSEINVPNYNNSAMDGYAVYVKSTVEVNTEFRCIGESYAGNPFKKNVKNNEAVKVMTGGMIPKGCNAVIMKELVIKNDQFIKVKSKVFKNQNIRFIGEDIKKSQVVLNKGREISEIDLGILASLGIATVPVLRRPRIGFISTGDELVSITKKLKTSQVYDSNRYLLHGLLKNYPISIKDYGVVKDKLPLIEKKFKKASSECDVLITTGGVSVGDADYVKDVLHRLGKVNFWKIAVKPGRPLAFGKINKCLFFGLPGNPVSVVVTFNLFVSNAINKLVGKNNDHTLALEAELLTDLKKRKGRKEYKRGILINKKNKLYVDQSGKQGSNILSSVKDANCYIELHEDMDILKKGAQVRVLPFRLMSEFYEQ